MSDNSRRSDAPNICMMMDDDLVEQSEKQVRERSAPQNWRKREKVTPVQMGAFVGSVSQAVKS